MSKSDEIHNSVDLTAYCGLYCGDCIRFECKASDLSSELFNEIDRNNSKIIKKYGISN